MSEEIREQDGMGGLTGRLKILIDEIRTGKVGELEVDPKEVVSELYLLEKRWIHDEAIRNSIGAMRNLITTVRRGEDIVPKSPEYREWIDTLMGFLMQPGSSNYFDENRPACEAYLRAVARVTYGHV